MVYCLNDWVYNQLVRNITQPQKTRFASISTLQTRSNLVSVCCMIRPSASVIYTNWIPPRRKSSSNYVFWSTLSSWNSSRISFQLTLVAGNGGPLRLRSAYSLKLRVPLTTLWRLGDQAFLVAMNFSPAIVRHSFLQHSEVYRFLINISFLIPELLWSAPTKLFVMWCNVYFDFWRRISVE